MCVCMYLSPKCFSVYGRVVCMYVIFISLFANLCFECLYLYFTTRGSVSVLDCVCVCVYVCIR